MGQATQKEKVALLPLINWHDLISHGLRFVPKYLSFECGLSLSKHEGTLGHDVLTFLLDISDCTWKAGLITHFWFCLAFLYDMLERQRERDGGYCCWVCGESGGGGEETGRGSLWILRHFLLYNWGDEGRSVLQEEIDGGQTDIDICLNCIGVG